MARDRSPVSLLRWMRVGNGAVLLLSTRVSSLSICAELLTLHTPRRFHSLCFISAEKRHRGGEMREMRDEAAEARRNTSLSCILEGTNSMAGGGGGWRQRAPNR